MDYAYYVHLFGFSLCVEDMNKDFGVVLKLRSKIQRTNYLVFGPLFPLQRTVSLALLGSPFSLTLPCSDSLCVCAFRRESCSGRKR